MTKLLHPITSGCTLLRDMYRHCLEVGDLDALYWCPPAMVIGKIDLALLVRVGTDHWRLSDRAKELLQTNVVTVILPKSAPRLTHFSTGRLTVPIQNSSRTLQSGPPVYVVTKMVPGTSEFIGYSYDFQTTYCKAEWECSDGKTRMLWSTETHRLNGEITAAPQLFEFELTPARNKNGTPIKEEQ